MGDGDIRACLKAFAYWTEFGIERSGLVDLYKGQPITTPWMKLLPKRGVQWFADYFVGLHYTSTEDYGLGKDWEEICDTLPAYQRTFLVGKTIGPHERPFDPTGRGSYFRDVDEIAPALRAFQPPFPKPIRRYVDLLERCAASSMGIYIRIT